MAKKTRDMTQAEHFDWWKHKLASMTNRTFELTKWGPHILEVLLATPGGVVQAPSLAALAKTLGVPLKFAPRGIASVTRLGIVTAELRPPMFRVAIHMDQFAKRKVGLKRPRKQLSKVEREALYAASGHRCACCQKKFSAEDLVLDHLVPLTLLGADHPANLVVMFRKHNSKKWDRLVRDQIQVYRREPIVKPFGVRFIDGAFWPVINGKVRRSASARTFAP